MNVTTVLEGKIVLFIASAKTPARGEQLTIQLLWTTARLLVTRFYPYLPS